jgi:hypothetical protein
MRSTRRAARSTRACTRTSVRYSAIDLVTKGVVGFFVLMSHEVRLSSLESRRSAKAQPLTAQPRR